MSSSSSASASAVPPEDDVCSVCHDRFRIPCQANCSHWFCGKSLLLLFFLSLPEQEDDPQAHRILGEIQHYNCIFGGAPHSLTQRLQDPTLLHPKTVQRTNGSPADSPTCVQDADDDDGVLGLFGFVDDLLILLIVFLHLAAVYRSLLLYRHGGQ
ncbi:unnamed protein product [Miscanthus lutarioriparius]|uniref:Uncharacterized protein n=1 Tax=Miscanthus lutarioriparius TaxID=422564 RepID=A0A811N3Y5_9POAL|nr:unnamed protein product [Miscanthus lutarioriparius]